MNQVAVEAGSWNASGNSSLHGSSNLFSNSVSGHQNSSNQSQTDSTRLFQSTLSELSEFLNSLEFEFKSTGLNKEKPGFRPETSGLDDLGILSCGCILSEREAKKHLVKPENDDVKTDVSPTDPVIFSQPPDSYKQTQALSDPSKRSPSPSSCPRCGQPSSFLFPIQPLRNIYAKIQSRKALLGHSILSGSLPSNTTQPLSVPSSNPLSSGHRPSDTTAKVSLLQLFQNTASQFLEQKQSLDLSTAFHPFSQPDYAPGLSSALVNVDTGTIATNDPSLASLSIRGSLDEWINSSSEPDQSSPPSWTLTSSPEQQQREYFYSKCFPIYRKQFQYSTSRSFLPSKSRKSYISTAISPDATKFALVSEKRWSVYSMASDHNDPPVLLLSGYSTGEYSAGDIDKAGKSPSPAASSLLTSAQELQQWQHICCSMSNRFLAIAGTNGILRVYDLENDATPVYHNKSSFAIGTMTMSSSGNLVACSIIGRDKITNIERPMIILHCLSNGDASTINTGAAETNFAGAQQGSAVDITSSLPFTTLDFVDTVAITVPYQDPINTLSFSSDGSFLSFSTSLESRFLVMNITIAREPRLVMKSLRRVDPSPDTEGITCLQFFPHSRLMVVTSMARGAAPIIVDTKLRSTSSFSSVAQPSMVMRIDKVGDSIYRAEVSPREDAVAFLDKNGLVYITYSPNMDNDRKWTVVATEVTSASSFSEAATLRFSPNGYELYIVDRKGNLHIEDFAAGLPQQAGVAKCRVLG